MRITEVEIKNFCQIEQRHDVLEPGVICVRGRNGAGKSNYMKALLFALTGESTNAGNKADDLRWGADKGSVRIHFSKGGVDGSISRDIGSAKCTMLYGAQKYKSIKEVDGAIYRILGASPKLLNEMVFVAQGRIEGVLFQRPAERARSLQSLFGTECAEALRGHIQTELCQISAESAADRIRELEARLSKFTGELLQLESEVADAKAKCLDEAAVQALEAAIANWRRAQGLSAERAARQQCIEVEQSRRDAAEARAAASGKSLAVMEPLVAEVCCAAENAKRSLALLEVVQRTAARRQQVQAALRTAESVLAQPRPPATDVTEGQLVDCASELQALKQSAASARKVLDSGLRDEAARCPTCNQVLPPQYVESCRASLSQLLGAVRQGESQYAALAARRSDSLRAEQLWHQQHDQAQASKLACEQELQSLGVAVAVGDEAELRKVVHEAQQGVATLQKLRTEVALAAQAVLTLDTSLRELREAVAALTRQLEVLDASRTPGLPELGEAEARLAADKEAAMHYAGLQGRHKAMEELGDELERSLAQLRDDEVKVERRRRYRELLERARLVLHRDQLPRLVAQLYVKALNERLAKYLELFEVPYLARIMDDISIDCTFGNRVVPAERLSGGEKVMLGIAFRFAVYDLFVSNLGLLILDEPTVYLDSDRIDSVLSLLERVKSYSRASGLQLIVVTHETRLSGVFDQVIAL